MGSTILAGDCRTILADLPEASVHCVVTSPPYWGLRDYGHAAQLGLEPTPEEYVANLVAVFRAVRRVLRPDGTVWLNLGDSYNSIGHKKSGSGYGTTGLAGGIAQEHHPLRRENSAPGLKHKDLVGIPWRVAFALQADGWWLRSDIVWSKPNPMPESVRDRPTRAHEYVFLLTASAKYYYDAAAIKEPNSSPEQAAHNQRYAKPYAAYDDRAQSTGQPGNENNRGIHSRPGENGRNRRSVWSIATQPFPGAHFAVMPQKLVEPCILAGCPPGGTVLDPFAGAGTVGVVAQKHGRYFIGIELNPEYARMAERRIADTPLALAV